MTLSPVIASPSLPADNCSRIDFAKMAANQLRQKSPPKSAEQKNPADAQKVNSTLATLDQAIKTGDSRKTDPALAAAKAAVSSASAGENRVTRAYADRSPAEPGSFSAWA